MSEPLPIARTEKLADICLLPRMANRHGLIAGATGTGKTVTLQVLAEQFSRIGVPVFAADIKGDLAGISQPGAMSPRLQERLTKQVAAPVKGVTELGQRILSEVKQHASGHRQSDDMCLLCFGRTA